MDDLKREKEALAATPDIDWAHYSRVIAARGVVDEFKNAFASLNVPKFDTKAILAEIAANEKTAVSCR